MINPDYRKPNQTDRLSETCLCSIILSFECMIYYIANRDQKKVIIVLFSECWPAVDSYKTHLNCYPETQISWCQKRREVWMFFSKSNVWPLQRPGTQFCDSIEMRSKQLTKKQMVLPSPTPVPHARQTGTTESPQATPWEVAAGRRRRAQQVSRGHSCNLMWHGFGQLWIALFCLPHFETAMPHLLTHFRIITQWQGQDMTSHRMPQIDALVVQPLSASKLLLLSFILPNWSVFSLTCT